MGNGKGSGEILQRTVVELLQVPSAPIEWEATVAVAPQSNAPSDRPMLASGSAPRRFR